MTMASVSPFKICSVFSEALKNQFDSKDYCDVVVKCDNVVVCYAHKQVLNAASGPLGGQISNGELHLQSLPNTILAVIQCIYAGEYDQCVGDLGDLIYDAEFYYKAKEHRVEEVMNIALGRFNGGIKIALKGHKGYQWALINCMDYVYDHASGEADPVKSALLAALSKNGRQLWNQLCVRFHQEMFWLMENMPQVMGDLRAQPFNIY